MFSVDAIGYHRGINYRRTWTSMCSSDRESHKYPGCVERGIRSIRNRFNKVPSVTPAGDQEYESLSLDWASCQVLLVQPVR